MFSTTKINEQALIVMQTLIKLLGKYTFAGGKVTRNMDLSLGAWENKIRGSILKVSFVGFVSQTILK